MPQFPPPEPGVTVVGAAVALTMSDGSIRTVEIPPEYAPDELRVNLVQVTGRREPTGPLELRRAERYEVQITVSARFAASGPGQPTRSFYRLNYRPVPGPAVGR